jgi:hypothetical protein
MRFLLIPGLCVLAAVACGSSEAEDSSAGRGKTLGPAGGGGAAGAASGGTTADGGSNGAVGEEATCASFVEQLFACNVITGTRLAGCEDENPVLPCVMKCVSSAGCAQVQADYCSGAYNDYAACLDECHATLQPAEFVCEGEEPIPASWRCDGLADCENADDEDCPPGEFTCADGLDLPAGWQCDGVLDCRDGEDEADCGPRVSCGDGTSVPSSRECDGFADCAGEEDERDCVRLKCP